MLRDCFIFISNAFFNFCFHAKAEVTMMPYCDNDVIKTFQARLFHKDTQDKVLDLFSFGTPRDDKTLNNEEYLAKCFDVDEPTINPDGSCNAVQQVLSVLLESKESAELLESFLDDLRGVFTLKDLNSIVTVYFH